MIHFCADISRLMMIQRLKWPRSNIRPYEQFQRFTLWFTMPKRKKEKNKEKNRTTYGPIQNPAWYINGWYVFANFSRSMRCQAIKFDAIIVFSLPKKFNDLYFVFGAHKIQKIISNNSLAFANISILVMIHPTAEIWSHCCIWSCEHFQ